jgi:hypothetical protein
VAQVADDYRMPVAGEWPASESGGRFSMDRPTELKTIVVELS